MSELMVHGVNSEPAMVQAMAKPLQGFCGPRVIYASRLVFVQVTADDLAGFFVGIQGAPWGANSSLGVAFGRTMHLLLSYLAAALRSGRLHRSNKSKG